MCSSISTRAVYVIYRIAIFETYSGVVYIQCDGATYDEGQVNGIGYDAKLVCI